MMSVYAKLMAVQAKLKAHKGQYNDFGHFYYRSCEDILEAVKPLLSEANAVIVVGDSIEPVGNRIYVKATARFIDVESGESVENTAYAREVESKSGMDGSQITGTASSYARKYCLNGLLLIDDTKDADTNEFVKGGKKETPKPEPTKEEPKPETKQETAKPRTILNGYSCSQCGKSIKSDEHSYSVKYFHQPLCRDCQKAIRNHGTMVIK